MFTEEDYSYWDEFVSILRRLEIEGDFSVTYDGLSVFIDDTDSETEVQFDECLKIFFIIGRVSSDWDYYFSQNKNYESAKTIEEVLNILKLEKCLV